MLSIWHFKVYYGTKKWGWFMCGIGWKSNVFIGVSWNRY